MQADLSGQVALVTGAARGIGKAIADRLAANGAFVAYTDVDFNAARQAAAASSFGEAFALDVTDSAQVGEVVQRVARERERLDILVNNAGVTTVKHRVTVDEFPEEEWNRLIDIDLTGLYRVSRAAASVMKGQGSGRIINVASVAGLVPLRLQCAYIAAKAGVVNLTKAMALELAPNNILVNAIAPGSILTDGTRQLFYSDQGAFHESASRLLSHVPLRRPGTADEVAIAALFLAAPENTYMTGHILTVDGGWTAGYIRDF